MNQDCHLPLFQERSSAFYVALVHILTSQVTVDMHNLRALVALPRDSSLFASDSFKSKWKADQASYFVEKPLVTLGLSCQS